MKKKYFYILTCEFIEPRYGESCKRTSTGIIIPKDENLAENDLPEIYSLCLKKFKELHPVCKRFVTLFYSLTEIPEEVKKEGDN